MAQPTQRRSGLADAGDIPRAGSAHPWAPPAPQTPPAPAAKTLAGRRPWRTIADGDDRKMSFSTRLPISVQRRLRIHSASTGEPIGELVERAVVELLGREASPNR